ncbi:sodium- and chloride-dependent GABA transporter 1-like [Argopecten irradians]|uniref:sodium- and chloride-dependent GABA transporter 1-like n=1 Tax=Argopecten irradians TaxID=31199 RepID=UPI003718231B
MLTEFLKTYLIKAYSFHLLDCLGLPCTFGMFETMTSAFVDEFPDLLANRKVLFTAVMCFIEFLLGVPCVMQGGVYILQIMDWYCATFSLMLLCLAECIAIAWIYGADRFYKDLELMIGYQPSVWWKICWCFYFSGDDNGTHFCKNSNMNDYVQL